VRWTLTRGDRRLLLLVGSGGVVVAAAFALGRLPALPPVVSAVWLPVWVLVAGYILGSQRRPTHIDPLTDLPGRKLFVEQVQRALVRARRTARPLAVLSVNLDEVRLVNEGFGHAAGDLVLVEVAGRLLDAVRDEDHVARLGGDEFGVLVECLEDPQDAARLAERIIERLQPQLQLDGGVEVFVRASVGIAVSAGEGEGAEDLLRNADVAMRGAKRQGKNGYRAFEPGMHTAVLGRLEMQREIERALRHGEFVLHYQPIVDLRTGRITTTEALVRWNHPDKGLLPPAVFIAVAEETGQINRLGSWVLREAVRQGAEWHASLAEPPSMSVNVSAHQFADEDFADEVRSVLDDAGLEARRLILEITESAFIGDPDGAAARMEELKRIGVRIAVDDFGTGYSSLGYLARFPVDALKVDRTFVAAMDTGDSGHVLAEAIVRLGHTLGMRTMAEGIETREQLERLRALGCDAGQGFLMARPLPRGEVEGLLARPAVDIVVEPAARRTVPAR
jgi:diguanylate cyclase (GGDEF)-like protein